MEADILKYGWLIVLTLAQIVGIWIRIAEKRNNKKVEIKPEVKKGNNPNYGERMGKIETRLEDIENDLERIKDKLNLI